MEQSNNVVTDTIAELNERLDRAQVLLRLEDWRKRTHQLYDEIQQRLGDAYFYDRRGKHRTQEEVIQQAEVSEHDVPPIDILRIEGPHRNDLAIIQPRYLWIIGANGRLDLIIPSRTGIGRHLFMLIDVSRPLVEKADWRLVSPANRLDQPKFKIDRLRELLG